jgi:phosphoribosylglycinamide formyltransferase-1
MSFVVFGYNFPHWKTQMGLINLCANGFKPDLVILQDRKELKHKTSNYRITPQGEYLLEPKNVCKLLNLDYMIKDHDDYRNEEEAEFAVILGARILKKKTIQRYYKGILNIHPGILPGNRGLDNLKWSILNGLPIGVTAHWIDERIDRGEIMFCKTVIVEEGDSIRDLYIKQRNLEQWTLVRAMECLEHSVKPCEFSEKFDAVPDELDMMFENWRYQCA